MAKFYYQSFFDWRSRLLLYVLHFYIYLALSSGSFDNVFQQEDKQLLLDLHNYYRASVQATHMNRLDWSLALEKAAQDQADSCLFNKELGTNTYYNDSELTGGSTLTLTSIVSKWLANSVLQPIQWHRTSEIGCAITLCGRLSQSTGVVPLRNSYFVVCKYSPSYFISNDRHLYNYGRCRDKFCPSIAVCVPYRGTDADNPSAPPDVVQPSISKRVTSIMPKVGSIGGGTKLTIKGKGFSTNQFEGGNLVTLVPIYGQGNITCDVVSYGSSTEIIECVTRSAPAGTTDSFYYVHVSVNDGNGYVYVGSCGTECRYRYRLTYSTPYIHSMSSYASSNNAPITLSGYFYSNGFDDPNDSDDANNGGKASDYYSRILVGGRGCNHMKDDGSKYSATLAKNKDFATVECKPELGSIIDSHNITVVLGKRGNSIVNRPENILSLDNHLRPYHFQTHADILNMKPSSGSTYGGTKITITMSHDLSNYINDIVVKVGGSPCDNVKVKQSINGTYELIECITRPLLPNLTYYPGGRGFLREVFNTRYLDSVERQPRLSTGKIFERLFVSSVFEGNRYYFSRRLSGFFVPPESSLYTFNVRSDDLSRVYLSTNMSKEGLRRILTINSWTRRQWNKYSSQYQKEPVQLEKDTPYYFEVYANQGGGPWETGLAVKLHNSSLHGGEYDADKEIQKIKVTSEILQEEHLVKVEATPHVQRITFQLSETTQTDRIDTCNVTLMISNSGNKHILIMPINSSATEWEEGLNQVNLINQIGRVSVIMTGHLEIPSNFQSANNNPEISLDVVFLTTYSTVVDDIPKIEAGSTFSCTGRHSEINISSTATVTQTLTPTTSFKVGFNRTLSGQPRFTTQISTDIAPEDFEQQLKELLSWGCMEDEKLSKKSDIYKTYETSSTMRTYPTAFCGFHSKWNPRHLRGKPNEYTLSSLPYICFAYKGPIPNLNIWYTYRKLERSSDGDLTRVSTGSKYTILRESRCTQWPFRGTAFSSDGWSSYGCIDARACINEDLLSTDTVQYDRHFVTVVSFNSRYNFYIDNLAFARSPITITRVPSLAPIQFNNVIIKNILATGGLLQSPNMTIYHSGEETNYSMTVAAFSVKYNVKDCGFGMELIQSHGSNAGRVKISRVQAASMPVKGLFDITFGSRTLTNVSVMTSASAMRNLFNIQFKEHGAFSVSNIATCSAYEWTINWLDAHGDQPIIQLSNIRLSGAPANASVITVRDGGVWIRPLRGDMLRIPEEQPQVEVIINKIPSSCTSKNCSFTYENSSTPEVTDIIPRQGQNGTIIAIYGNGFSETSNVTVVIGNSPCQVFFSNESVIHCVAGTQSAGCYRVNVSIEDLGVATSNEDINFEYVTTVQSIEPSSGGLYGGNLITISGNGFPRYEADDGNIATLWPWFRYGVGLPYHDFTKYNYCPFFYNLLNDLYGKETELKKMGMQENNLTVDQLKDHINEVYSESMLQVTVGDTPCIIANATETSITCVPLVSSATGVFDLTVTMYNESYILSNSYTIHKTPLMTIDSISPTVGPVVGNFSLQILGTSFGPRQEIQVMIGMKPCEIQFHNNTYIECTAPRMEPGRHSVFVYSQTGIAVKETVAMNSNGNYTISSLFPTFTYKLEITNMSLSTGSAFGGTALTVYGGIFVANDTSVLVGKVPAIITSISDTELTFLTPSYTSSYSVSMSAQLISTGYSSVNYKLQWEKTEFEISVGDSIVWNWDVELNVDQKLRVQIFETISKKSAISKQGGFMSSSNSQRFSLTLSTAGTYYFASTNNLNSEIIFGEINVTDPETSERAIDIFVGGIRAKYTMERPAVEKHPRKRRSLNCNSPPTQKLSTELTFVYSPCFTPAVFSVTPTNAEMESTVLTIQGERFSTKSNSITIGGFPCVPLTETENELTCRFSLDNQPPPYMPLLPTVINNDPGYGKAYIQNITTSIVTVYPIITSLSPRKGSLKGGTDIAISGAALQFVQGGMEIQFGDSQCIVKSVNYTGIYCTTIATFDQDREGESVQFIQNGKVLPYVCKDSRNCTFTFSEEVTPEIDEVIPKIISTAGTQTIRLMGSKLSNFSDHYRINVGNTTCSVISANTTAVLCELAPLQSGPYMLQLSICDENNDIECFGNGLFSNDAQSIMVEVGVTAVRPMAGSVFGETQITLSGYGFSGSTDFIVVTIGDSPCDVLSSTIEEITCVTSAHSAGLAAIFVTDQQSSINTGGLMFDFTTNSTPAITSIVPSVGISGQEVIITGKLHAATFNNNISITIGGAVCERTQVVNDSHLNCELGPNFAGSHPVIITVPGIGSSSNSTFFTYLLSIDSISNTSGSFAGGNVLIIYASGFDPSYTTITICGQICPQTSTIPTSSTIECVVPAAKTTLDLLCDVKITSVNQSVIYPTKYIYKNSLTAIANFINDTRGGTEGGTPLQIGGIGFAANGTVTIANSPCIVVSWTDNEITCVTSRSGRTVHAPVMVWVDGKGFAQTSVEFWYVDLWSSRFTWGGGPLPREGDFVVIPKGQTLVLDTKTPVLAYLLIQGGELIFDREKGDNEVELHTNGGLITSGGRLEVGTEENPFLSKTRIVLYGHVLSTEIPLYGAKTLALRKGEIDMHGRPLNVTWTRLSTTALAGDEDIHVQDYVDWDVGGKIVLASTSFSQRENEEKEIKNIEQGPHGSIITLTSPLEYEHISVEQTIAGKLIETKGEVGYLTRNIVVRGNRNEEWDMQVPDCPEEFRPGQFEVQTCFQGRFGSEVVGDQFGSQIMIHAAEQNKGHVRARFEYIEVTHAGQAFRLGRYPIHFHLNGNVSGSYVRGCGIHHTFNRAVTIHAVDYLLVEKNVAFDILGHAYFLEDGIEQYNVIQDNLGVFIRASSSLLNVDITPATFWVVNPRNYIRRNAAAGGTHFGFWYRLTVHPTGPSFTNKVCPQKIPVLQFENNTAHSFGWYGLWIFRHYYPTVTGECSDTTPGPSHFDRFFAWRNDRGVEFSEVGSMQLRDSIIMDNTLAGVEYTDIESVWDEVDGPLVTNTLIIGHSKTSVNDSCTASGLVTPKSYYLTVSGVTFANFNKSSCVPITACSHCRDLQGGFETRYQRISYENAGDRITKWQWTHEQIHRDLDGSLTLSNSPKLLIPTNELLDPNKCHNHPGSAQPNGIQGSICDGDIKFGRLAIFDPAPDSLEFAPLNVTNNHGRIVLPYVFFRLRGTGPSRMMHIQLNNSYDLAFQGGETLTNISYTSLISGFSESDYVLLRHVYPRSLDKVAIAGITSATNESTLLDPTLAKTGDYYLENNSLELTYIIKGGNFPLNEDRNTFKTERCRHPMCIPPTPPPPPTLPPPISSGRPDNAVKWSNISIWPNNTLPIDGSDVIIPTGTYVLVDIPVLPRINTLVIKGGLEILDNQDRILEANVIIIDGGRFVAGYPDAPFRNMFRIILYGNVMSPDHRHGPSKVIVGSKAIGVFGELFLHAEMSNPVSWTVLGETANVGSSQITLSEAVDWEIGDEIVITSTSFDAYQTETFQISSISNNKRVLNINGSLGHTHLGVQETVGSVSYSIRAEVGRLTRNIVIENGDPGRADSEAFGCRVLVSSEGTSGTVQLEGVEFKGCGQIGHTESYDPRFALAFVNTGRQRNAYVKHCSFHDGYNTALGLFGTDNMEITNNVIHSTVGPSMIVTGASHHVVKNLASLSQFIGTYRNRDEPLNSLWTANFEITGVVGINFTYNHAAGGAKAGIHSDGEECVGSSSTIQHNLAHSSLHGFHMGYKDGNPTCSRYDGITAYACYHYGFFSYSPPGVQIYNSTFINNKAAIYITVQGPSSLSHRVGKKTVLVEGVNIISASKTFDCSQDSIKPDIAKHRRSHSGLVTPTGGHVGIFNPEFMSNSGGFPHFSWTSIHGYPAIAGHSTIRQVSFTNFGLRCGKRKDTAIMTSQDSEDANHPIQLERITFESDGRFTSGSSGINDECKLYTHEPNVARVNPSDCVDMDCDGMKHVILTDTDGSFSETNSFRTIISKAEFQWNGDRRRGLGDYRIPKTMLTRPDGSRIPVEDIYPQKGVVRSNSFNGTNECTFNPGWNMYLCENLEHLLLVMESLDEDTEVRRLSPIGVSANGFINLLNGPMDHGWCGGYTCQERISTFYGIVASSFNYTIGLSSVNPQKFALHLINANENQGIITRIIYTHPQRLDVYVNNGGEDVYIPPKNAKLLDDGNLEYASASNVPDEQYFPTIDDEHGANFYDRSLKQLHVNIKGKRSYKIITTPVIVLSVTLQVTTEEFFAEEFLVRNLALLLNIPSDRIRVVNVVRETPQTGRRRKRQAATEMIEVEIGDPPTQVIADTPSNTTMSTNMTMNMTSTVDNTTNTVNATNTTTTLSFQKLAELTETVAEAVQTGEILQGSSNVALVDAEVEEPIPEPVDPTGGVRATENTGGPQPEDVGENTTMLTFAEKQKINETAELNKTVVTVHLSLPSHLTLSKNFDGTIVEGLALSTSDAPLFTMYDNNGMVSETLGIGTPWKLTATIKEGPQDGFLRNHVNDFIKGRASYQGIVFSHPGMYKLEFAVSYPKTANFSVAIERPVSVQKRSLSLAILKQPQSGNTTFPLYPYPVVRLFDSSNNPVQDHTWRNSTWYVSAYLRNGDQVWTTELVKGEAIFTNIKIAKPGRYNLIFKATTNPLPLSKDYLPSDVTSMAIEINTLQFTRFSITYSGDYNTVVVGREDQFITAFKKKFKSQYTAAELFDITVKSGSIIVATSITAKTMNSLVDIIDDLKTRGQEKLSFNFQNLTMAPSNITQDPNYRIVIINVKSDFMLILIIAISGGVTALLVSCIFCILIIYCCKRNKTKKTYPVTMATLYQIPEESEADYDVEEYYLKDDTFPLKKEDKVPEVVSSMVEVPGSFFVNPTAQNSEEKQESEQK